MPSFAKPTFIRYAPSTADQWPLDGIFPSDTPPGYTMYDWVNSREFTRNGPSAGGHSDKLYGR